MDLRFRGTFGEGVLIRMQCWITAAVMAVLVLTKLALVSGQLCSVAGNASADDALFVELARSISEGDWLGPYSKYTLVKGPMYPLWIAALFRLHVPLFLGQHLFYAFACWLMIRALRPLRLPLAAELAAFALVLFNPVTWSPQLLRVVRSGIYPSLTLLVIACAVGIYTHRRSSRASLAAWSTGLGIALAGFWLTREEGIWLFPTLGLIFATTIFCIWRSAVADRFSRFGLASIWMLVAVLPVVAVCQLNSDRYGMFSVAAFKRPEFRSAYGALTRVTPERRYPYVSVSAETRQRIYRVSPAFLQLQPYLDGETGRRWATMGADLKPAGEIASGWFIWALHHAASKAGYTINAKHVLTYYQRLALEVNNACEQEALACGPPRSSMFPVWQDGDGPLLTATVARALLFMAGFVNPMAAGAPSVGNDDSIREFEEMTRERAATPGVFQQHREQFQGMPSFAEAARRAIARAYQALFKWWLVAALAAWVWAGGRALKRRSVDFLFVLNAALVGACVSRAVVLSWMTISSFNAINPLYFSAAYPLMLLFCVLATVDPFTWISQRQQNS